MTLQAQRLYNLFKKMRKALEFYEVNVRNGFNNNRMTAPTVSLTKLEEDKGQRAKEALTPEPSIVPIDIGS